MQEETGVALNTIEKRDKFLEDVRAGRWDQVLVEMSHIRLTPPRLIDLYEQIVAEMIQRGELDLAKTLLRKTEPMNQLKLGHIDRYLRLEHCLQAGKINMVDFYQHGVTTDTRRGQLADALASEVVDVAPSRLLSLLTQALKWQQYQGLVKAGSDYDLFRGDAPLRSLTIEEDACPNTLDRTIKFLDKNRPECARFSPDAQYLVTGSVDGFIEVWDYATGKLATDLDYQMNDDFMMHDKSILCLNFSRDGEYLASGSLDGRAKVWQIKTGKCLRKFEPAHAQGVTCIAFTKTTTQILTGSFDSTLKIHGLKSGKSLKVFRGHQSFINDCCFNENEDRVISCSSDATVRIWDAKSTDCLQTLRTSTSVRIKEIAVRSFTIMKNPEFLLICNTSPTISIMSMRTQNITKQFTADGIKNFLCCTLSPQQNYLYAVSEDHMLHCFDVDKGTCLSSIDIHTKEVVGITHHPNRNLVATYAGDALLKIWKSVQH
eukprot:gene15314-18143_t